MSKKHITFIKPALQGCAVLLFAILLGVWAGSNPSIPASVTETEPEDQSEPASESMSESGSESEAASDSEAESDTSAVSVTADDAESESLATEGSESSTDDESETETQTEGYSDVRRLYKPGDILRTDSENPLLPYSQYKITEDNSDWFVIPEDFIEAYLLKYQIITSDTKVEIVESSLSWTDLETILRFMTDSYEGTWSIYVKDLKNDRTISINDQPMEAASLIKLYIMGTVYEQLGMSMIDENLSISDALYNMITVSDNESANMLVRALDSEGEHSKGLVKVNDFIQEYGFTNTEQVNGLADPSLWSDDGRLNRTSARDCGMFLEYVYRGEMVSHLASRDMESLLLGQEIDYKIPDSLPSEVVSASKTGEVEGCENDTAIVYSPGGDYIICIMSNGWSDDEAAVSRIHSLSEAVYAFFNPDSGYTITIPEGQAKSNAPLTENSEDSDETETSDETASASADYTKTT